LLLGKDKGGRFIVTTLLVPKQHSTSDTCTMDEEELVMQFTEERSLITLGWVRRHSSSLLDLGAMLIGLLLSDPHTSDAVL
jgi:STAM-binding protein